MFLGRTGGNRSHQDRWTDVPVATYCTKQELSGEHLDQALHLHPCLTLLLFLCPSPCCPKDAASRWYLLSPVSQNLFLLNSLLP